LRRFAVLIADPRAVEEFVGLARVDTEAPDEDVAAERAVRLYSEFSEQAYGVADVRLVARVAEVVASDHPPADVV
jgi:hypothetical protein